MMTTYRVHAVFVFAGGREEPQPWGIVSDLDLAAAAWAGIDRRTAGDSAVAPLVTVAGDDALGHAAQLMAEHGVANLVVLDPATRSPVGIVSTLDVARAAASEPRLARLFELRR